MRRSGGAINATSLRPKTAHPSNRQQAPPPLLSQYHSFQIAFADWAFNARQRPKIYANLPTFRLGTWAHNLLVIPAMAPTTNPLHPRTDHSVDASIRSKSPASPTREFSYRPYIPSSSYRRTILAKVWDTKYAAVFIESETSEKSPSSPLLPGSLVSWAGGIHANSNVLYTSQAFFTSVRSRASRGCGRCGTDFFYDLQQRDLLLLL